MNAFTSFPFALISPRHLHSVLARQPETNLAKLVRKAKEDGGDESQPWWKSEDLYGEKLPAPSMSTICFLPVSVT